METEREGLFYDMIKHIVYNVVFMCSGRILQVWNCGRRDSPPRSLSDLSFETNILAVRMNRKRYLLLIDWF